MSGINGIARNSDDMTSHFRFRLVKKEQVDGKNSEQETKVNNPITLRPKNVNKESDVKIRSFDQERHFACVKKSDGCYECVEVDTEEFVPQ